MTYKIEKDVPIPKPEQKITHPISKTLLQMEVGDSVFLGDQEKDATQWRSFAKRMGIMVTIRKVYPEGYRLWVIEQTPNRDALIAKTVEES